MSLKTFGKLVLIGAGKMGGAMLEGWLARGYPAKNIHIQDPGATAALTALAAEKGMSLNAPLENLPDPDVVLLAVKPQMMDDVLRSLGPLMRPGVVFLSIAAGKTIDGMTAPLREAAGDNGGDLAIVRSIPNTPAAVGRGSRWPAPMPMSVPRRRICARPCLKPSARLPGLRTKV